MNNGIIEDGHSNDIPEHNGADVIEGVEENDIDEETQQKYRIWKKNTPFLYDYVTTHSLLWPSLTVQFFPDLENVTDKAPRDDVEDDKETSNRVDSSIAVQRVLIGTFTLGQGVDHLSILQLPYYKNLNRHLNLDLIEYNSEKEELMLNKVPKKKVTELQKITHLGDVNRARYVPQNPDIISSSNSIGDLVVYDRTKHSNFRSSLISQDDSDVNKPQLKLVNEEHPSTGDIYALEWNQVREGTIAAADMDGNINFYDIKSKFTSKDVLTIRESRYFNNDGKGINDLQWVPMHHSVFCIGDELGRLRYFDLRLPDEQAAVLSFQISQSAIDSISINPGRSTGVATGDDNGIIKVWDIRSSGTEGLKPLTEIKGHEGSITLLKWHNKYHNILGSSSSDKMVKFYDLGSENESPELFVHAGHMLGVNDFDWSQHDDWLTASVADDNSIHFWKPSSQIVKSYQTT